MNILEFLEKIQENCNVCKMANDQNCRRDDCPEIVDNLKARIRELEQNTCKYIDQLVQENEELKLKLRKII